MVVIGQKASTETLYWSSVASPRGQCVVMATERGVCWTGTPGTPADAGFSWLSRKYPFKDAVEDAAVAPLQQALDELLRYFAGEYIQFACPLDLYGTPFQIAAWQAMFHIPYGETRSYGELAQQIGYPNAARALGAASAANPVAIIVPCHRVVGSNGQLVGYGGGLPTKQWLLALERSHRQEQQS